MRLFGIVDGTVDANDRPHMFIEPFVLTVTSVTYGAITRSTTFTATTAPNTTLTVNKSPSVTLKP